MQDSPELSSSGLVDPAFQDAQAFHKGKGRLLASMLALVLLLLAGFAWYVLQDQPNPYGELGRQVNGLRAQYFDAFWTCMLPGKQISELHSDADVRGEIEVRAMAGARYGAHVRKCVHSLGDLSASLRALLPPEDAAILVQAMAEGVSQVSGGATSFATYLEGLDQAYDPERGAQESETMVRGWYEFRRAHAELNTLIKGKLGR